MPPKYSAGLTLTAATHLLVAYAEAVCPTGTHAINWLELRTPNSGEYNRLLSVRVTADVLGHIDPAMTQRRYMARGRVHTAAAEALDRAVSSGN